MENKIVKERLINSQINKVWSALTDTQKIAKWFLPNQFDPKVGGYFKLTHEEDDGTCKSVSGEILEFNEPNRLVYSWDVEGSKVQSKVIWSLIEQGDKTLVRIEHINL